jgi:pimeloyl-ACP methyl ester carboxylesterase
VKQTPPLALAKAGAAVLKPADLLHQFTNSTARPNRNRKFSLQPLKRASKKANGQPSALTNYFNVHIQIFNPHQITVCETIRQMDNDAKTLKSVFIGRLRRLILICVALYAVACIGCASFQRSLIYFPQHQRAEQVNESARAAGLQRWNNPAGQAIGMKRMASRQPADGQVLIAYGNGSWSVGSAHYADDIQSLATFDVFILEYPGYADRAGSPSQKSIFHAADEALQLLGTNKPVYLLGESLGSGVAAYLAGTHPDKIAGVILLSPYNRLTSVAQDHLPLLPVWLMLVDRFPSEDYLRNYHGPVGIMVDGRDEVVPEKFGLRLYDSYAGPKRLWSFPDGYHISIMESTEKFWGEVLDFWQTNQISAH